MGGKVNTHDKKKIALTDIIVNDCKVKKMKKIVVTAPDIRTAEKLMTCLKNNTSYKTTIPNDDDGGDNTKWDYYQK